MKLLWATLHGFKRFEEATKLDVSARVVSLLGPNEAGKSSVLKALAHLNHDRRFSRVELTRGGVYENDDVIVEAGFLLGPEDRTALASIDGASDVTGMRLAKLRDGERHLTLHPEPIRARRERSRARAALEQAAVSPALRDLPESSSGSLDLTDLTKAVEALDPDLETLPGSVLSRLEELASLLEEQVELGFPQYIKALPQQLRDLAAIEGVKHPRDEAERVLRPRIPRFLLFSPDDRSLASDYDLQEVVGSPPAALANLCQVGDLSLAHLLDAVQEGDQADVHTLTSQASARINEAFSVAWRQSEVRVALRVDGRTLHVQIEDVDNRFSSLGERSDGLRQFVALLAFTSGVRDDECVLLVDEAETHLHYNAQADLVQMLTTQTIASKVLYTTHSAGCLPEDLGTGVRLVQPLEQPERSRIRNAFWHEDEPGFEPVLFGMGASTLAFVPLRFAVFVEGASDVILLPSVFRQAIDKDVLGFQVAPGLSNISSKKFGLIELAAPRVAFLMDGDEAGDRIEKRLLKAGIHSSRVFRFRWSGSTRKTLEDILDPGTYAHAVEEQVRRRQNVEVSIPVKALGAGGRVRTVGERCKKQGARAPGRTDVAYQILEFLADEPGTGVVDPAWARKIATLHEEISAALAGSASS